MSELNKIIGKRIKDRRNELGMTQKQLAQEIGCAEITVRQYESGRNAPKIDTRVAIANALKIGYAELFAVDYTNSSNTSIDIAALKRGDIEHAIKEPADLVATFTDENGNPVTYAEHYEPATDEERNQLIDLLLKTGLSAEKRAEMLNYFDFIKYKEKHGIK